jgi:hypothetical protein
MAEEAFSNKEMHTATQISRVQTGPCALKKGAMRSQSVKVTEQATLDFMGSL